MLPACIVRHFLDESFALFSISRGFHDEEDSSAKDKILIKKPEKLELITLIMRFTFTCAFKVNTQHL